MSDMNEAAIEQVAPHGTGVEIGPLVKADIDARVAKGIETYGEPLRAHNGRDALIDLYQEMLDGVMYFRQLIEELKDD